MPSKQSQNSKQAGTKLADTIFPVLMVLCLLAVVRIHLAYAWSTRALGVLAVRIRRAIDEGHLRDVEEVNELYRKFDREVRPNRIIFDLTIWSYEKACPGY